MEESLWELLTEVNWKLILLLPLIGGILSIIGDRVGMKFAKRRVTLFGLRPRHTSSLLTAITGMFISLFVIIIMAMVSETVRTSLFSMQYIQRQIVELTRQLQDSRNEQQVSSLLIIEAQHRMDTQEKELSELQSRADELRKSTEEIQQERDRLIAQKESLEAAVRDVRDNLGRLQEGRIVAFADERLGQEVIPEGITEEAAATERLDRLNERVRYEIARRANVVPATVVIIPDEESYTNAKNRILDYDSRKVVRAQTTANVTVGEPVGITYSVFESVQVYYANEEILSRALNVKTDSEESELVLSYLLRELNHEAQRSGILNDPLTGMVGGIPVNDFYDGVARIAAAVPPFRITLLAAEDIYSEGPVSVQIVVESGIDVSYIEDDGGFLEVGSLIHHVSSETQNEAETHQTDASAAFGALGRDINGNLLSENGELSSNNEVQVGDEREGEVESLLSPMGVVEMNLKNGTLLNPLGGTSNGLLGLSDGAEQDTSDDGN